MWYTDVSGLWQTVWMESVPSVFVRELRVSADLTGATVLAEGVSEGTVTLEDGRQFPLSLGRAVIPMPDGEYWTPDTPRLYRFTLTAGEDRVSSYFALRTVSAGRDKNGKPRLLLNGKPYFFHGLLDQGYFPEGILTPPSYESYTRDILAAKEMGFNLLRKHIKVEPERFYYECDRHGMAVLQDAVNNGDYSFLRDTALPTLGFRKKDDRRAHPSKAGREAFLAGLDAMVKRASRFPSVVGYTLFNEGWGQFDHAAVYQRIKAMDPTRFVDSVSGWFTPKAQAALASDVLSEHIYFKPVSLTAGDRPLLLSEFGGYTLSLPDHVFSDGKEYGYRRHKDAKELWENLSRLYLDEILPAIEKGLCLTVYTQLSDVEDETNGLLTYDRRVMKVPAPWMRELAESLYAAHRAATE
jgi:beta-galactosidase/beta-glucuronidase